MSEWYKKHPSSGQFKKGHCPSNGFKKGRIPWNKNKKAPQISKSKMGNKNPMWGGGKIQKKDGRWYIKKRNHPFATAPVVPFYFLYDETPFFFP